MRLGADALEHRLHHGLALFVVDADERDRAKVVRDDPRIGAALADHLCLRRAHGARGLLENRREIFWRERRCK